MIQKKGSVPMYEQIISILKKEIEENKYAEGSSIGTHEELTKRFDVSLITVRRAVEILQEEGLVVIRQGKGTFVRPKAVVDDLKSTRGVAQLLDNIDAPGSVVTARRSLGKISSDLADNIKKEIGVHCLRVEKIHEANGMVYGYAKIYLPAQYEELFTVENLENYTVYDI